MTPPLYTQAEQGAAAGTREARHTPPVDGTHKLSRVRARASVRARYLWTGHTSSAVSVRERLPKRRRIRSRTVKLRQNMP